MRGVTKAVVAVSALAIAAGATAGVQLVTQASSDRRAATAPATTSSPAPVAPPVPAVPAVTTTTVAPSTTTEAPPPPPPPPAPATTAKPKPKPAKPAVGAPCRATARACIDLSANKSWLLDGAGNVTYGPVPITHGRAGWRTPPGTFRVGWKDIDHKSSLFDNAPMPYSVFFNGGIAFHQGSLSELSHGCIHLSAAAAKKYYNTLRVGDIVQVVP